jgi:hypothetical protein
MMCHATLTTESKDAKAVAKSLNADNVRMQSLTVSTAVEGGSIRSDIRSESLTTLLATVDDLLRCQITSESLI